VVAIAIRMTYNRYRRSVQTYALVVTMEDNTSSGCHICINCFNYKAECICDRIISYDAETDIPVVEVTDEEWDYIYSSKANRGK
jgi:hypothetical protein